MQFKKDYEAHSYNCKLDYTQEPRYSQNSPQVHNSCSSSLKLLSRSPSPVKLCNFMQPSLPTIQEISHLPHSQVQLDKLFHMVNDRPSSRYDIRDSEMENLMQEINSVIDSCVTVAGRHRKPKRPIDLPQLPLRKYMTCANNSYSRNHSYRNHSAFQNNSRSNLKKQNSVKLLPNYDKRHVQSSSTLNPSQYSKLRTKYTKTRKANSSSCIKNSKYIQENVKISKLKDIPTNIQTNYLSNASVCKSIILVTLYTEREHII